jgi:hypothetical protein
MHPSCIPCCSCIHEGCIPPASPAAPVSRSPGACHYPAHGMYRFCTPCSCIPCCVRAAVYTHPDTPPWTGVRMLPGVRAYAAPHPGSTFEAPVRLARIAAAASMGYRALYPIIWDIGYRPPFVQDTGPPFKRRGRRESRRRGGSCRVWRQSQRRGSCCVWHQRRRGGRWQHCRSRRWGRTGRGRWRCWGAAPAATRPPAAG